VELLDIATVLFSSFFDGVSITLFLKTEFTEEDLLLPFTVDALLDTEDPLFLTALFLLLKEFCLLLFLEFIGDAVCDDAAEDDDVSVK